MKTLRPWILAMLLIAFASFVAIGCGDDSGSSTDTTASSELAADQVLHINLGGEPEHLDPGLASDVISFNTILTAFAGLTKIVPDGDEQRVEPSLAESYEISEDGKTYTFKLREGLKWSNGDPLVAEDFRWAWLRNLDPKLASDYAYSMYDVVGAEAYNSGTGKPEAVGVKAVDTTTLEVTLDHPVPWFDQLVSTTIFFPLHRKTVEQFKDKWTEPENIVSSGPFKMTKWEHDQSIEFVKNEDFWDAENVTLTKVDGQIIADKQTAFAKYKNGELDAGYNGAMFSNQDIDAAKEEEGYYQSPSLSTQYIGFNMDSAKVKDVNVRIAVSKAMHRANLTDNVLREGQMPVGTFTPPGIPGYDVIKEGSQDFIDPQAEPDIEEIKELLAEGGFKDGDEITLQFTSESPSGKAIADALASDLSKVGVKVKLLQIPTFKAHLQKLGPPLAAGTDMYLIGWQADYADAHNFHSLLTSDSGNNSSAYKDPEFDKLVAQAATEQDSEARYDLEKQAEGMLTGPEGGHPVAPLYADTERTLVQPYVRGFEITAMGLHPLDRVQILEHSE